MALSADDIRKRIKRCRSLPSLPAVAMELLEMWDDEDVSIMDVAKTIKKDPSLTAKLVKLANSPFYGWRSKVGSVDRAVSVLGLNATMSLSLGFSLVKNPGSGGGFDYDAFWRRSGIASVAARTIGAHLQVPNLDELFLGGLLQDFGVLVLNEALGDEYRAVLGESGGDHDRLVDLEIAAFGADHATFGGELIKKWGFPANLIAAVGSSHDPRAEQDIPERTTFARAIACGALVADCFVGGGAIDERAAAARAAVALAPLLDADEDAVSAVLHETSKAVLDVSGALDIDFGTQDEIEGALEEAREALVMLNLKAEMRARDSRSQVDQLVAQQKELETRANTDALTGVQNRASLDEAMAMLFSRALKTRGALSVLFVDLDHFKRVNDTYGHQAGDAVLATVGNLLEDKLRPSDVVGRYGGEEFLVILPGASEAGASKVGERIRESIAASPIDASGTSIEVTASFGYASQGGSGPFESGADLVKAADTALYEAKESGRNRVVGYRPR